MRRNNAGMSGAADLSAAHDRVRVARRVVVGALAAAVAAPIVGSRVGGSAAATPQPSGTPARASLAAARTEGAVASLLQAVGSEMRLPAPPLSGTGTASRAAVAGAVSRALGSAAAVSGVAVLDLRTGVTWNTRGDAPVMAGSAIKPLIASAALRTARARGVALSTRQLGWVRSAIRYSDNGAASSLYTFVGGHAGVAALAKDLGLTVTAAAAPATQWGATLTTPLDLVRYLCALTGGNTVTHPDDDAVVLGHMAQVSDAQDWGVGSVQGQGVATRLKNGWMSVVAPHWVINTFGDVTGSGRSLVVAVMQDKQPSQRPAMTRATAVCQAVFDALATPLS